MRTLGYCWRSGKVKFRTYWHARRILADMNRKTYHSGGCVYRCFYCHHWHITHYNDVIRPEDLLFIAKRPSKKQKRSRRRIAALPWHPPIPLRTEINSIKQYFNNPELMTTEEKARIWESEPVRMARLKMELSYIMADVMNSFMMDAECELRRHSIVFHQEEKRKWTTMVECANRMKAASKQVAKAVYEVEKVDEACQESDLFADLMLTIAQRVNDCDRLHMEQTYKLMKATIVKNFKNLYIEHKTNI